MVEVNKTLGGCSGAGIKVLELKMVVGLKLLQWILGFYIEVISKSPVVDTWVEIESSLAMMLLEE